MCHMKEIVYISISFLGGLKKLEVTDVCIMDILQWIVTRDIDLPKNQNNVMKIYAALQNTTWAPTQPGVKSRPVYETF